MSNTPNTEKKLPEAEAPGEAHAFEGGREEEGHGELETVLSGPGQRSMHAWLSVVDLVQAEYERLIHGRS